MDSLERAASALSPIRAIVWGEYAMCFAGVKTICNDNMLVIQDSDVDAAILSLHSAGFRDAAWSFGCTVDPETLTDTKTQEYCRGAARTYRSINANSLRFEFPADAGKKESRLIIVRSSYAHFSLLSMPGTKFTYCGGVYFPDSELLLESFVKVRVRDTEPSAWTSMLTYWSITYLYGQLWLDDDVLDSSEDEEAKTWFNKMIRRFSGGLDRLPTKRRGRRAPDTVRID
ncbi:hypothetical protein F4777DRAFT_541064 [Nemania sp. FL0916]|nr:hypothetical protein F4777DRAFT_541064 [Nemania sp. FL0916]